MGRRKQFERERSRVWGIKSFNEMVTKQEEKIKQARREKSSLSSFQTPPTNNGRGWRA